MPFVAFWCLSPYYLCRLWCLSPIMTFVAYRVCRSIVLFHDLFGNSSVCWTPSLISPEEHPPELLLLFLRIKKWPLYKCCLCLSDYRFLINRKSATVQVRGWGIAQVGYSAMSKLMERFVPNFSIFLVSPDTPFEVHRNYYKWFFVNPNSSGIFSIKLALAWWSKY